MKTDDLEKAARGYAEKYSAAPDKECPTWIINDFKAGAEWAASQFKGTEELPLNFWQRLEMFVKEVQVNDPMSEEEKEMILRVARNLKVNAPKPISPKKPGQLPG